MSGLQIHNLYRTGDHALAALDAVGMQITAFGAAAVVGRQLHGTYARTALALHLACIGHMYVGKTGRERSLFRRHPRRQRAHRAERAPGARRVNERERHAHYGRNENDGPEHTAYGIPVAPRACHLYAEHGEDEQHHEETETECAHKFRYRAMRRIFGK